MWSGSPDSRIARVSIPVQTATGANRELATLAQLCTITEKGGMTMRLFASSVLPNPAIAFGSLISIEMSSNSIPVRRMKKRPNKALEPTPGSVTPRATEGVSL